MILTNGAGIEMWDFADREVLSVFGPPGSGRTSFARHVAMSWAETGVCNVIVGTEYPEEWDDLRSVVHVATPHEAFGLGQLMKHYPMSNCVVVIDDADRLDLRLLPQTELRGGVAWTFMTRSRLFDGDRWTNLALGKQTLTDLNNAFGINLKDRWRHPMPNRFGYAASTDDDGIIRELRLADDFVTGIAGRVVAAPPKSSFSIPKRDWYAPAPWMAA